MAALEAGLPQPNPEAFGHLDSASLQSVSGWAFDPLRPDGAVELEVLDRDTLICRVEAGQFRLDLLESGYGNGRHAFSAELPADIFLLPAAELRVRIRETGQELQGSPVMLANRRVLLTEDTLAAMDDAIASTAATARSARELQGLATWLLRQLDTVWGRQSALESSARARSNRFYEMVAENNALSDLLREAAEAVVARHAALHLPEAAHPDVSVIIPVHNAFADTYRCLEAILRHRPGAVLEVIVADDGSCDETVYAGFVLSGGIRLLRQGVRSGLVSTVNAAAAAARGRMLLLLGNETEVEPGWLDALLATAAEDAAIGIAGPKLLQPDGSLWEAGRIVWRQGMQIGWGCGDDAGRPEYGFLRDADAVSGAALLIRRSVFNKVGGLSSGYLSSSGAALDLCFTVRAAGMRVVVQPLSRVTRHGDPAGGNGPSERADQRVLLQRWSEALQGFPLSGSGERQAAERLVTRRALVIDDAPPRPELDWGSSAVLDHMRSLQRLGYQVSFAGAEGLARVSPYTEALEGVGIQCYCAPYYGSVEEILRREVFELDVFYVRGQANLARYAPMIRQRFPGGRIVFNPGDQATAPGRARWEMADAVIVPSAWELEVLRSGGATIPIQILPGLLRLTQGAAGFAERSGISLADCTARVPAWFNDAVMPVLKARMPGLELRTIARAGDYDQLLLAVVPVLDGPPPIGSILTSLAAGVPCVMTAAAASGLELPAEYADALAADETALAAAILRVANDPAVWEQVRRAGLDHVRRSLSPERIDSLMATLLRDQTSLALSPPVT